LASYSVVAAWTSTCGRQPALALVDGQTKALTLAARVALASEDLPAAVAEMLGAHVVTDLELIQGWLRAGQPTAPIARTLGAGALGRQPGASMP
jgi:hypothetical protein